MAENDFSIFVGDLALEVTDYFLLEHFRQYFPSVKTAKVINEPTTGRSKGYGFVRFGTEHDRDRALTEMNGVYICSRPIRVSIATAKRAGAPGAENRPLPPSGGPESYDPNNTTLFIGGLSSSVGEEQLRAIFSHYGELIYVKIPQGKGCGFVQFVDRKGAEQALQQMNGMVIGNNTVRISWGRSNTKATQHRADGPNPSSAYGYSQGTSYPGGYPYDPYAGTYGATAAYHDPYATYGQYPAASTAYTAYPTSYPTGTTSTSVSGAPGNTSVTTTTITAVYDPAAPLDIDHQNAMFMHRYLPLLTAGFMHQHPE